MSGQTVVGNLIARAEKLADRPFVRCGSQWRGAEAIATRAQRLAGALRSLGLEVGDRVAVILPNREEMVDVFFGCALGGIIQVPLNAWLKGEFLRFQLRDSDPLVLITDEAGLQSVLPLLASTGIKHLVVLDGHSCPDGLPAGISIHDFETLVGGAEPIDPATPDPSDLVSIIYTSGTTGDPKGCMLSNAYYLNGPNCLLDRGWVEEGDRLFTSWPLFHTSGQVIALMSALLADGSVSVEPSFSASTFLHTARQQHATVLCGVGFMGAALLAQPPSPDDRSRPFRCAWWIPMSPEMQLAFEQRFATPVLCEAFGQTECFPVLMSNKDAARRRSSLGTPNRNFDVMLVDDHDAPVVPGQPGEIVVRPKSPGVMFSGYWRNEAATVAAWRNLWHHTGDLAVAAPDGSMSFVDRKKDSIRRRGENVSSLELETAISRHPDIEAAAVCAVPSTMGEDDIKAAVVLREGSALDPQELFTFLQDGLPYFAMPRYVDVRNELPTNALGRVTKHVLRDEGITDEMWDFERLGLRVDRSQRRGAGHIGPIVHDIGTKALPET